MCSVQEEILQKSEDSFHVSPWVVGFSNGKIDVTLKNPTDRGYFDLNIIDENLKYGPCKPKGPFIQDDKK